MYGDRQAVWNGRAYQTTGGLCKDDLFKRGRRILSRRVSQCSKKKYNLRDYAFTSLKENEQK